MKTTAASDVNTLINAFSCSF